MDSIEDITITNSTNDSTTSTTSTNSTTTKVKNMKKEKKEKKETMPSRLHNTEESLERLLIFLEKQTIYKPKMCEVPGYEENYELLYEEYIHNGAVLLNEELLNSTNNLVRNYQFNKYRPFTPPLIRTIKLDLMELGCITNGSKLNSTKLEIIMNYFMFQNLKYYFADLNKSCFELYLFE
jgi:hypothetical protein